MVKLLAVLSVPAALLGGLLALGVVVVDVREAGPDGHRIVVPVPLALAQTALAFVPQQRLAAMHRTAGLPVAGAARTQSDASVEMDRAGAYLPLAREVLQALAAGPDGELVRVEEPDEQVVIAKVGDTLRIRVHTPGEDVRVNVPIRVALAALPGRDGRIRVAAVAGALGSVRFRDLVDVRSGGDQVKVYVW